MRISVREGDPGYSRDAVSCVVLLDGAELKECFTADEELGEAWCYVLDGDGRGIFYGSEVKEECLRGEVKIIRKGGDC